MAFKCSGCNKFTTPVLNTDNVDDSGVEIGDSESNDGVTSVDLSGMVNLLLDSSCCSETVAEAEVELDEISLQIEHLKDCDLEEASYSTTFTSTEEIDEDRPVKVRGRSRKVRHCGVQVEIEVKCDSCGASGSVTSSAAIPVSDFEPVN